MTSNGDGGTSSLGVIEGYQVFRNSEDQAAANAGDAQKQGGEEGSPAPRQRSDSSDSEPPVHFQVKSEPVDASYEQGAAKSPPPSDSTKTTTPPPSSESRSATPVQISPSLWSGGKGKKETRKPDSNVGNVIEQLLRKNEYLLAQNDAGGFRPNPRKSRNPNELLKKPDTGLDSNGTTFLVSQTSQARVAKTPTEPQTNKSLGPGRILRPRSPTRKCSIPEKDKSHFNHAVMESNVVDKQSDRLFRVNTHEMVCAVSCRAMFMTQGGALVAHFDLQFYWCNFCPYHTTNKAQLLQHVMEHRFHCKFCRYQSFSRADVIHHTAEHHTEFSEAANSLKYCTLLSDYLQIYSQDTEEDKTKRAGGDDGDAPPPKISKLDNSELSGLYGNLDPNDPKKMELYASLQKDYEYFDMEVETVDGNATHEDGSAERPAGTGSSTYDVSKMITNVQSSGTAMQVLLDKYQTQNQAAGVQPVSLISSVGAPRFPAQSKVFTPIAPRTVQKAPTPAKPFENRPPPPPPPANKMRTGSSVSSNLYWSCGYCSFTSHSQGEIKEHSQKTHRGRPHRYVALIRPPEKKSEEENNENDSLVTSKDIVIDRADDNTFDSAVDSQKKIEPPTYKCFHCFYEVKKPGLLKGHISYKHRGLSLVGLDIHCETPDKYMYFCPRDDCPFRAKNPNAYLNHVERCTPWHNKDLNVQVENHLLKCLDNTVQLAEKMKEQVRSLEEYSCIYCSFTGCDLWRVVEHMNIMHADRSIIVRDLQMHRYKKKSFIFSCRVCNVVMIEKDEWIQHSVEEHGLAERDLHTDFNTTAKNRIPQKCKTKKKSFCDQKRDIEPPVLSPACSPFHEEGSVATYSSDESPPSLEMVDTETVGTTSSLSCGMTLGPSVVKTGNILPQLLQCRCCKFRCIGVPSIKQHFQKKHPCKVMTFVDLQKEKQGISSCFFLCPYKNCVYSSLSMALVQHHHNKVHPKGVDSNGNLAQLQWKSPRVEKSRSNTNGRLKLKCKSKSSIKKSASSLLHSVSSLLLRCRHCKYILKGVSAMKTHLDQMHAGKEYVFVNLKKRIQKQRSIFHVCTFPKCTFTHYDVAVVAKHAARVHSQVSLKVSSSHKPKNGGEATEFGVVNHDLTNPSNTINVSDVSLIGDESGASIGISTSENLELKPKSKDYSCIHCKSNFVTDDTTVMKEHFRNIHAGKDIVIRDFEAKKTKLYMCRKPKCLELFSDSQSVLLHQLAHSGGHVFECSKCWWSHPELMKVMNHLDDLHESDDADIAYLMLKLERDGRGISKIYDISYKP